MPNDLYNQFLEKVLKAMLKNGKIQLIQKERNYGSAKNV
jgi:hypothetical protein